MVREAQTRGLAREIGGGAEGEGEGEVGGVGGSEGGGR